MNLSLLFTLVFLILPFVVVIVISILKECKLFFKKEELDQSTLLFLEELMEVFPKYRIGTREDSFIHDITHFLNEKGEECEINFFDGKISKIDAEPQQFAANNFIQYNEKYWINSHYIKKIKNNSLQFFNHLKIAASAE